MRGLKDPTRFKPNMTNKTIWNEIKYLFLAAENKTEKMATGSFEPVAVNDLERQVNIMKLIRHVSKGLNRVLIGGMNLMNPFKSKSPNKALRIPKMEIERGLGVRVNKRRSANSS